MITECCNKNIIKDCCGRSIDPGINSEGEWSASLIWKIALALVLAGQSMVFGLGINISPPEMGSVPYLFLHGALIVSSIVVMLLLGRPLFEDAVKSLKNKKLSLEGLFLLSALGALIGSLISTITGRSEVYYEVVSIVLVIYTVGKILSSRSRKKAIDETNKTREMFDYAYVMNTRGEKEKVSLDKLDCCSEVAVGPGDAISVDGIIIAGEGFVYETAMTGELDPVVKKVGDYIFAGSFCVDAIFSIKPTALKDVRRLDSLLNAVEKARLAPSNLQEQADKIIQWFLPLVITVSVGTFLFWFGRINWVNALFNSMAVLLVACPCALGLATPIAIWSGLWKLSRLGLISRSGEFLDSLARAHLIIFDKTGTLSEENLTIVDFLVVPEMEDKKEWLKAMIHTVESKIDHPIARALSKFDSTYKNRFSIQSSRIIPGKGIEARLKEANEEEIIILHLGERELVSNISNTIPHTECLLFGNLNLNNLSNYQFKRTIFIGINGKIAGIVLLNEKFRSGLPQVFAQLKDLNIKGKILTGDPSKHYHTIEGIEVLSGLSPKDKEIYIKELEEAGKRTIFLGDGINDAAAMSESSASIAMGKGAALTQSSASAILIGDTLEVLPKAIKICRQIRKNIRGNMIYAVTYNCIGMSLAAMGILHPVVAALLMLFSSISVSILATKSAKDCN